MLDVSIISSLLLGIDYNFGMWLIEVGGRDVLCSLQPIITAVGLLVVKINISNYKSVYFTSKHKYVDIYLFNQTIFAMN